MTHKAISFNSHPSPNGNHQVLHIHTHMHTYIHIGYDRALIDNFQDYYEEPRSQGLATSYRRLLLEF